MDMRLEMVVIPVADVDGAKAFYEQVGFNVDVDHRAGDFRVVQVTPPGSACSVSFGTGMPAPACPVLGLHLVVADIEAAREELVGRGVEVGELWHMGAEGQTPGPHPERVDYGSFATLEDPAGNVWLLQEIPSRG